MRDLVYNGTAIREREEMMSLTDMWRAAGSPDEKRPAQWARYQGAEFIAFLADALNMRSEHISITRRGRGGGTYAHWQVALAYAKYLSSEFHVWCNTVVREHMEGSKARVVQEELELAPPSFEPEAVTKADFRKLCEWVSKKMAAQDKRQDERLWDAIKQVVNAVWHAKGSLNRSLLNPENLAAQGVMLLPMPTPDTTYETVTEICWRVVPQEHLHSAVPSIVGKRLLSHARQHHWAQGETAKRSLRDRPMPTYPVARVEEWLAAGGAVMIELENTERRQADAIAAGAIPLQRAS
jgi:hypothetical protein